MRYSAGLAARKKPDRRKTAERAEPKPREAGFEPSAPDIRLAYAEAGRETYDEITQQMPALDMPEIVIGEAPAGRDTLSAIAEELATSLGRRTQTTLPYGDRISNAPGARTPKAKSTLSSAPEIVVSHSPAGRETLSAIAEELAAREASKPDVEIVIGDSETDALPEQFEIFELATFVVRGREMARLSSEALRRRFVQEHLLARLPVKSMDSVDRVDVTPWTVRGTVVVRVWCRLEPASTGQ